MRRQPLGKICPQPANPGGNVERRVLRIFGVPRLRQPELHVVAEELPNALCDLVEMAIARAGAVFGPHAVVEPVSFVCIIALLCLIGDEGGVAAKIEV